MANEPFADLSRRRRAGRCAALLAAGAAILLVATLAQPAQSAWASNFEVQSLDGSGNNLANPTLGQIGTPYSRVGAANYADGRSAPVGGPNVRNISNRLINDLNQNVFSEGGVTQWLWTWGQFLDHTFGLAQGGGEAANIPFSTTDPLETFRNDLGVIPFQRDAAAAGTGVTNPRQQINTVSSYIDAYAVYGGSAARLDYLRTGPLDGNPANNAATLLLPGGYLPTTAARGGAALPGPAMAVDGRLRANPTQAKLAGDVRANENIALTATHTLFAREHNRIVGRLPNTLTDQQKFNIAREVVIAEQQFITYNEFLPAAGVNLPAYRGYNPAVNPSISNEFATVGYRAHSQIHGEFEVEAEVGDYTQAQLNAFEAAGIDVEVDGAEVVIAIPLNVAFFNPNLLEQIGEGAMLKVLGGEAQYKNDEMIDNQLRSVLFQVPTNGQTTCIEPVDPRCFAGVVDLGAIDIQRGREHGMPTYNQMRQAYGLAPRTTFQAITGEATAAFPADALLTRGNEVNDANSLDITQLLDKNGAPISTTSPAAATDPIRATKRTTLAARMQAVYGNVNNVDAFMGMIAEPHAAGSEFGELQRAIWARQFQALRDGDRFFFGNNTDYATIQQLYGIDFHRTLAQVISDNAGIPLSELSPNVFRVPANEPPAPGRIQATFSGRCIDVPNASTANNTQLQIFDCNGAPQQDWVQPSRGGPIQIFGNKCLDKLGGNTAGDLSPVVIFDCNGNASQQWTFQADGQLVNAAGGLRLDVHSNLTANGTPLRVVIPNGTTAQVFIR
jgi:hypothetical protein